MVVLKDFPEFFRRQLQKNQDLSPYERSLLLSALFNTNWNKTKAAKVATARTLWGPAVNNHGGYGRWAFLEIADPWDAQNLIRAFLTTLPPPSICA